MKKDDSLVQIAFQLETNSESGFNIERLWAKHVRGNIYVIDNSPFQVFGVSFGDEVEATRSAGELKFADVVKRGGHSTYRVRLPIGCDHSYFLRFWGGLAHLGCTYEGADGEQRIYAIDIPDPSRVADVYRILQEYEDAKVWEFEEAHYFKPH